MTESEQDIHEASAGDGVSLKMPGLRLRRAREALGWSREQVAAELKLQVSLIGALEEGNDAELPPPAFVNGYLRSYSKLVGLPDTELVKAYEQHVQSLRQPEIVSRTRNTQVSSRDLPVRLVTWAIFAGLAVLLVSWWLSQRPQEVPVAETEMPTLPETSPESFQQVQPPFAESATPAPESTAVVDAAEVAPPSLEAAPAGLEPAFATTDRELAQPVSAPPAEAMATASGSPPQSQPGAPPLLRMEFEAESWTEVSDADGRELVHRLVQAGEQLTLDGTPPFRVFLGYAPGVKVYHDGVAVDPGPYRRGNIARFRVPRAGE